MKFRTYEGAYKRAAFERADAKYSRPPRPYTYRVIPNTNSTQLAQGYAWIVKKEKLNSADNTSR